MSTGHDEEQREIRDRLRRIETKVTNFLEANGFDTKNQKPVYSGGQLVVPSIQCTLAEVLMAIPDNQGRVDVYNGTDFVCVVEKPDK
jgi:hypothetical protein